MRADLDLVILGGGCAGLSLAERLAEAGPSAPKTQVLEARVTYTDDRTWSFWRTRPHRYDRLVHREWSAASVHDAHGRGGVAHTPAAPYQTIRGGDFYAAARARIAASERVALDLGVRVEAVRSLPDGRVRIDTDRGPLTARRVIDTRPDRRPSTGGAQLWQSFVGREIATDGPLFDTDCATLMRFSPPRPDRITFTYVLPFARDRALIETTVLAREPIPADALSDACDAAVAEETGGRGGTILRTEAGILPMGLVRETSRNPDDGIVRAGLTAGGARPSSGYAFRRIQSWADACADALLDGGSPVAAAADGPLLSFMDGLFLRVLAADPARGPEFFAALFARTPPMRLVRFLSDEPSLLDAARLAAALPPSPFLRALVAPPSERSRASPARDHTREPAREPARERIGEATR